MDPHKQAAQLLADTAPEEAKDGDTLFQPRRAEVTHRWTKSEQDFLTRCVQRLVRTANSEKAAEKRTFLMRVVEQNARDMETVNALWHKQGLHPRLTFPDWKKTWIGAFPGPHDLPRWRWTEEEVLANGRYIYDLMSSRAGGREEVPEPEDRLVSTFPGLARKERDVLRTMFSMPYRDIEQYMLDHPLTTESIIMYGEEASQMISVVRGMTGMMLKDLQRSSKNQRISDQDALAIGLHWASKGQDILDAKKVKRAQKGKPGERSPSDDEPGAAE